MTKPVHASSAISPAMEKIDVNTASDTVFPVAAKGLYVGTGGNVVLKAPNSGYVTYKNVPSGGYIDGYISEVRSLANGTTAGDLIADF